MFLAVVAKVYYLVAAIITLTNCVFSQYPPNYNHQIVVRVEGGSDTARNLAATHALNYVGQVGSLEDYYLLEFPNRIHKRSTDNAFAKLERESQVQWSARQEVKKRVKRDLQSEEHPSENLQMGQWQDPFYTQQWYLRKGGRAGFDMNVEKAWKRGLSGKGISISILDDGLQWRHPDLRPNYDQLASLDINGRSFDPTPTDDGNNKHGTRCAGEIAAVAGNNICGVGVAFNASIGGVRMLDGEVTDHVEATALSVNPQHVHTYSASWGPDDDGQTVDGPGPLARQAFENGIKYGRQGYGSIYVWASGNGGKNDDSCSCDGYANSLYTISVSSAAQDGSKPWYLEECPSTLTTTYSSGNSWQPAVVTTDLDTPGNQRRACTNQHTGTSASAPLAAGIIALALEANPKLTWRDMQHLMVRSSNPKPLLDDWIVNGANRQVSNKFGYGLLDADKLVELAASWTTSAPQHVCRTQNDSTPHVAINNEILTELYTDGCADSGNIIGRLEHVQAVLTIQAARRGNIRVTLTSPMNTTSILLPRRSLDASRAGFTNWAFTSVQLWDEDPRGTWRLHIEYLNDLTIRYGQFGSSIAAVPTVLKSFTLVLYGTEKPYIVSRQSVPAPGDAFDTHQRWTKELVMAEHSSVGAVARVGFSWLLSVILGLFLILKSL
ncbi:endoprotease bli-like [Paramacrobiotus metropolitanus]|uniref:endoprotease bli-like n=1 Tax=Paramacrobiotus metropolitanus TaxID=2943436 RepID=UPI002446542A|nr:endoprotease bli-like [Paramacrobiotus metropolitanus]